MNLSKAAVPSRTSAVAGAIAGLVREHRRMEAQALDAGAVDLATDYINQVGIHVCCVLEFADGMTDHCRPGRLEVGALSEVHGS